MVIDFNTLANIEPAVLAVYDMPIGTDLEFCFSTIQEDILSTRILENGYKTFQCVSCQGRKNIGNFHIW